VALATQKFISVPQHLILQSKKAGTSPAFNRKYFFIT